MHSGVLKPDVALYMFSYEAIQCNESEHFWDGIGQDKKIYWGLLDAFANDMKKRAGCFSFTPERFVF
jgi:hypothetical protein